MSNSFLHKDKQYRVGDTIKITYKIREGEKTRNQIFAGVLLKIKGTDENTRMITVRKVSKSGIGVERILPLFSPHVLDVELVKSTSYQKAKLYFIRDLSEQKIKHKIYKKK